MGRARARAAPPDRHPPPAPRADPGGGAGPGAPPAPSKNPEEPGIPGPRAGSLSSWGRRPSERAGPGRPALGGTWRPPGAIRSGASVGPARAFPGGRCLPREAGPEIPRLQMLSRRLLAQRSAGSPPGRSLWACPSPRLLPSWASLDSGFLSRVPLPGIPHPPPPARRIPRVLRADWPAPHGLCRSCPQAHTPAQPSALLRLVPHSWKGHLAASEPGCPPGVSQFLPSSIQGLP